MRRIFNFSKDFGHELGAVVCDALGECDGSGEGMARHVGGEGLAEAEAGELGGGEGLALFGAPRAGAKDGVGVAVDELGGDGEAAEVVEHLVVVGFQRVVGAVACLTDRISFQTTLPKVPQTE